MAAQAQAGELKYEYDLLSLFAPPKLRLQINFLTGTSYIRA